MDKQTEYTAPMEELMPLIRESLAQGKTVRLTPKGTSMLPMLRPDRDSVELSPITGRLRKYDLPLYQRRDGSFVLHRIVRVGENYTCRGDHQYVDELGIEQTQLIALVTAFVRSGKLHRVDSLPYQLYCRLWVGSCGLRRFVRRCIRFLHRRLGGGKK